MYSVILAVATRYLTPLMLVFSVILLFRGHKYNPGGGFIGGLLAAGGFKTAHYWPMAETS